MDQTDTPYLARTATLAMESNNAYFAEIENSSDL